MNEEDAGKRKITVAQAIKVLGSKGVTIDEKEAETILDFLYFLGKLTVNQYIKDSSMKSEG